MIKTTRGAAENNYESVCIYTEFVMAEVKQVECVLYFVTAQNSQKKKISFTVIFPLASTCVSPT